MIHKAPLMRSREHRDAILISSDFRDTLKILREEEGIDDYDLCQLLNVSHDDLVTWRIDRRPGRGPSTGALGRLILAWKYWLHVGEGDPLGQYLRHTPEGHRGTLLLIMNGSASEDELIEFVDALAEHAIGVRKAAQKRRRELGGLTSPSVLYNVE